MSIVRMMIMTNLKPFDCFSNSEVALQEFEMRLTPPKNPKKRRVFVDRYIDLTKFD